MSTEQPPTERKLLHVGCGFASRERLPACFQSTDWKEIRFDIEPAVQPDILGSMTDMSAVEAASVDAIYSSHNLEHLHAFEVPVALGEFRRVLKPTGFALLTLPDLRAVARAIADDHLAEPLYISAAGPINPLDVVFGHQPSIQRGLVHMAHRTGFSARTLADALLGAGFAEVRVHEGTRWDLWAVGTMPDTPDSIFEELSGVLG